MVMLALVPVTGCGPRFTPPAADPTGLDVARQAIIATAPAVGMAGTPETMLADVSQRLAQAAQPLCTAYGSQDCALQITFDPSATARAAMSGQGRVTITLGMLRLLGSEDEVAAVLGHEFGHHLANHISRRRARGLAAGTVAGTLHGAVVPLGGLTGWALSEGAAVAGSQGHPFQGLLVLAWARTRAVATWARATAAST
jgi:Zn-dependent protease with chaperone function